LNRKGDIDMNMEWLAGVIDNGVIGSLSAAGVVAAAIPTGGGKQVMTATATGMRAPQAKAGVK
jgi:hypothetical protein